MGHYVLLVKTNEREYECKKKCKKRWSCIVMCMAAAVMVQAEFVGGGALG